MPTFIEAPGARDFRTIRKAAGAGHRRAWRRQIAGYNRAILQSDVGWMLDFVQRLDLDVQAQLRKLYRSTDELPTVVRRQILINQKVRCCPYCGLQSNVTVDHYLPQKEFPQFSVLSRNLVPACSDCQSHSHKGNKHPVRKRKGNAAPGRFAHPYLDRFLRNSVLGVRAVVGEELSEIEVFPRNCTATQSRVLDYHIREMKIASRVSAEIDFIWQKLRREAIGNSRFSTSTQVKAELRKRRDEAALDAGSLNAIAPALLNSLIGNSSAVDFLIKESSQPPVVRSNQRILTARW